MRWPWSKDAEKCNESKRDQGSWTEALELSEYAKPATIVSSFLLTSAILMAVKIYVVYLRRIPDAQYIRPDAFRKRSIFGKVTRVGDADNFHLFHTPGGRLGGWGWLPGRRIPAKKQLKDKTIHVRLAGVDAPEGAHFGKPAQPFSGEALAWLRGYIENRRVRAYVYKRDQYERVVATVFVRRWLIRRDVGKEMLKAGMATVYEAKSGSEFGELEATYRAVEAKAKRRKLGIWSADPKTFESPRAFKNRTREEEVGTTKQGVRGRS